MGYQLSAYFYSNLSYQKCVWFIFVTDSITKILCLWTCTYERKGYIVAALLIYLTVHNPHHMGMTQGDIFMCLASPCWWCTCSYPQKKNSCFDFKNDGSLLSQETGGNNCNRGFIWNANQRKKRNLSFQIHLLKKNI